VKADEALVCLEPTEAGCVLLIGHRTTSGGFEVTGDLLVDLTTGMVNDLLVGSDETHPYLAAQVFTPLREWVPQMLAEVSSELGRLLGSAIAARLTRVGVRSVTLVLGGRLGLLPIHAAAFERDGQLKHLIDDFDVTYAPSAWVHGRTRSRAEQFQSQTPVFAAVGNPTGDLASASSEVKLVSTLFGPDGARVLYGGDATKRSFIGCVAGATHVHMSCHGRFIPDAPLDSRLVLAGGEGLTLAELIEHQIFGETRLAVASACLTATTEFTRIPDESLSFAAGLIHSGAAGVVGALWPVHDLATAILMIQFYERYLRGSVPPSRALAMAQRWLRTITRTALLDFRGERSDRARQLGLVEASAAAIQLTDDVNRRFPDAPASARLFENPFYWAPFVIMGA
jgi:CHAT domain-containing protein